VDLDSTPHYANKKKVITYVHVLIMLKLETATRENNFSSDFCEFFLIITVLR
jgi:hypothetical protein